MSDSQTRISSLILPLYVPTLCIMFGYGMIVPVLPLFARALGASVGLASMVVGARGAGSMLFDLPAGVITSRLGRLPVLLLAAAAAALAATATAFVDGLRPLLLLTLAMGATQVLWVLSVQTHIRQNLPSEQRGRAMALVGGVVPVGWVLGPIAGGYVGKTFGLNTVYFGQGMFCFLALVFVLIGSAHYRFHSREQKGEALLRTPGIPFLRTLRGRWNPFLLSGLVVVTLQMLRIGRQTLLIGLVSQVFGLQAAPFLITAIGVLGAWLMIARVPETLQKR